MKSRAFTLIELLVVVLIISILSAIALPQYQKAVLKSRFVQLKILTNSLAQAEELYYLANSKYATDLTELDIELPAGELDPTDSDKVTYDWGFCYTNITNSKNTNVNQVACKSTDLNMEYLIRLTHSTDANKRYCVGHNTDLSSLQNQICKAETSDPAPGERTSWVLWVYQ